MLVLAQSGIAKTPRRTITTDVSVLGLSQGEWRMCLGKLILDNAVRGHRVLLPASCVAGHNLYVQNDLGQASWVARVEPAGDHNEEWKILTLNHSLRIRY